MGTVRKGAVMVAGWPKMYLSEDLQPEQIDYLYSELACFRWIGDWLSQRSDDIDMIGKD